MDRLYCALSQALEELLTIEDLRFAEAFCNFVAKLEYAFRQEEVWLEEMQCPSVLTHLEEHARALSALHHLHSRIMAGGIAEGREAVRNVLPQWLACHMANIDFAMTQSLDQAGTNDEPSSLLMEESGFIALHQDK
jgi:hemerythrin